MIYDPVKKTDFQGKSDFYLFGWLRCRKRDCKVSKKGLKLAEKDITAVIISIVVVQLNCYFDRGISRLIKANTIRFPKDYMRRQIN